MGKVWSHALCAATICEAIWSIYSVTHLPSLRQIRRFDNLHPLKCSSNTLLYRHTFVHTQHNYELPLRKYEQTIKLMTFIFYTHLDWVKCVVCFHNNLQSGSVCNCLIRTVGNTVKFHFSWLASSTLLSRFPSRPCFSAQPTGSKLRKQADDVRKENFLPSLFIKLLLLAY